MDLIKPKPVEWVASSKENIKSFPDDVQDHMGYALHQGKIGTKHLDAKPFKGHGSGVLEVVSLYDGDTYRAVYTVRFVQAVYVLHAFQKKSQERRQDTQAGRGFNNKAA